MMDDPALLPAHRVGEQSLVERADDHPIPVDTYAGRIHIEWDPEAPITPMGQMAFFIAFLKTSGLFDSLVAACPLHYRSPNAPSRRDVLGTALLSVLSGHRRYAHITALRADTANPPLLGMSRVLSEDAIRRAFEKIGGRGRCRLVARATRLHDASATERTLDPGHRHDRQAAVWRTGRRCGELQPFQTRPSVAHISQLHGRWSEADSGGRGPAWQ